MQSSLSFIARLDALNKQDGNNNNETALCAAYNQCTYFTWPVRKALTLGPFANAMRAHMLWGESPLARVLIDQRLLRKVFVVELYAYCRAVYVTLPAPQPQQLRTLFDTVPVMSDDQAVREFVAVCQALETELCLHESMPTPPSSRCAITTATKDTSVVATATPAYVPLVLHPSLAMARQVNGRYSRQVFAITSDNRVVVRCALK